jgi:hypothetical protein
MTNDFDCEIEFYELECCTWDKMEMIFFIIKFYYLDSSNSLITEGINLGGV